MDTEDDKSEEEEIGDEESDDEESDDEESDDEESEGDGMSSVPIRREEEFHMEEVTSAHTLDFL